MGTIINLICLAVIIVFIVDISGVITHIKEWVSLTLTHWKIRKSNFSIKPFDCSLCMTWWCGLIYLLCVGKFTLPFIMAVALLGLFSNTIKNFLLLISDIFDTIIAKINRLL